MYKIKAALYTGITVAMYALTQSDAATTFFKPVLQTQSTSLLFISLGIAQVIGILLLIKPRSVSVSTAAEVTLLISALVLVFNGQILFVMGNIVLLFLSKFIFASSQATSKPAVLAKGSIA